MCVIVFATLLLLTNTQVSGASLDFNESGNGEEAVYSNTVAEEWNRDLELNHVSSMLAAPSMLSIRSCVPFQQHPNPSDPTYQNQQQIFSQILHAHSQPQLSHSCSQPYLASQPVGLLGSGPNPLSGIPKRVHPHGRIISSSADKLTSMSFPHLASSQQQLQQQQQQPTYENGAILTFSFHEQVRSFEIDPTWHRELISIAKTPSYFKVFKLCSIVLYLVR